MSEVETADKADVFHALHERGRIFVLPNPWDIGTAKILAALGFEALATTSAGYAFSRGRIDWVGEVDRDEALAHAGEIVQATSLPVSADLENGFGESPETVAETVQLAAAIGLAGCTIEDTSGDPEKPIYDKSLAIERIAAGAEAVASLDRRFALTARAENYLHGRPDLDDTLERLTGYEAVGADVLYAPGLPGLDSIEKVCASVSKPVNVVAGIGLAGVTLAELEQAGVTRVSVGSSLARTALGAMLGAAQEIRDHGTFTAFESAAPFSEIERLIGSVPGNDDGNW
ncbi:MAG: isocitrate lyase/phosphoenolpyruvate mutase family protein [Proteobacteria bacterium]|nr:isocitrate lyase/phosphoenolpyruvate mutase family protein [Pseudomonadota bacterium]